MNLSPCKTFRCKSLLRKSVKRFPILFFPFIFLFCQTPATAQVVKGYVLGENNQPLPHVNVYLKNGSGGTITDVNGRYFLRLQPGDYDLVFSFVGYEHYEVKVVLSDSDVVKNVWMKPSSAMLEQLVVKATKKDPAYDIIRKVIDNRKETVIKSLRTDVYIKARETQGRSQEKINVEVSAEPSEDLALPEDLPEVPDAGTNDSIQRVRRTNMVEMYLRLDYQAPDKYKEERLAFKAYGSSAGLFIPVFSESDFNIYENLISLKGVSQNPMVSPLSSTAILSYRYKLEEVLSEEDRLVYKISFRPRKRGNSTMEGILYVNDSLWNINRFDISFPSSGLKFYDEFGLKQHYRQVLPTDTAWMTYRQEFTYKTKGKKGVEFLGSTVIHYNNQQLNYPFPAKYFGVEVSVATRETYERDSSYWISTRPEQLTPEEQEMVRYRDSIYAVVNSKIYRDSMEALFNKVTLGDLTLHGLEFRKYEKHQSLYISPLVSLLDFSVIGGFRLGPYVSFGRRMKNGQYLLISSGADVGFKNKDFQGDGRIFYRYLPFRMGDIEIDGGRYFQSINPYDAYLNQLRISNYILSDFGSISHRIELFNGFYLRNDFFFSRRQSIENYDPTSIINEVLEETEPIIFQDYSAFVSQVSVSYTPAQRYMREPTFKRVLGSRYPRFTLSHKKGWPGLFNSDVDFDYGEFNISQNLTVGILGNSRYSLRAGKFLNTRDLKFIDLKRFRESDPYLFSDPLHSFQELDTSLTASDWFFEAHHIHHFNGAFVNNIPLIKKTKINLVAGAGILWIHESGYRYEEVLAGVERIFKLGPRRRLRLGLFGVLGESNKSGISTGWKVSFDIIDTWKRDWSF